MQYHIELNQDLRRNPYPGKYYAFEGIDGSGKSTQVEKIKKHLENLGQTVVITSEPQAEGAIQKVIRDALFAKVKIPSRAYQDLYSADRAVNHAEIVEPTLKHGNIVLTHRSFWSAVAYGILDLGDEYDFSRTSSIITSQGVFAHYHQFLAPDKTFYLRVSAKHAVSRLSKMEKAKDIYEKEEKLAKIVTGYDKVVAEFPEEFVVIDGEQNEEEVTNDILKAIK
jgi:dTMP kinase